MDVNLFIFLLSELSFEVVYMKCELAQHYHWMHVEDHCIYFRSFTLIWLAYLIASAFPGIKI